MITTVKKLLTNLSHLAKDKKAWLALVAGLFLTLSYAPYNLWFLTFLSLGALLYCINPLANGKLAAKKSAKYAFLVGSAANGATTDPRNFLNMSKYLKDNMLVYYD